MRPLAWAGVPPRVAHSLRRAGFAKGATIASLRRMRGLECFTYSHSPLADLRCRAIASGPAYRIGEAVSFAAERGLGIKEAGWSSAEASGTWTDGGEATVCFRLAAEHRPSDLILSIDAMPFSGGRSASGQRVEVTAGRTFLAHLTLSTESQGPLTVDVPPNIQLSGRLLRISLSLPDAVSPRRLGRSADIRKLGIFVRSMQLDYA